MPRLTATRPAPAPMQARKRVQKPITQQDRLKSRTLFMRRVKRSVKPGLWALGLIMFIAIVSQGMREIPAVGPIVSPVGGIGHDFGEMAAVFGFRITKIEVNGADTTPLPVIESTLGVAPGDPILGFSLDDAVARLEQLGPVQTAVIERALPGTLIINISERAPYAIWQTAGDGNTAKFVLIDKAGNVIANQDAAAAKRREPNLLLLAGADAPQNVTALMAELNADPAVKTRVIAAQRVDGLRWNLILKNQTLVKLPADNEQAALDQLASLQTSMALLDRPVESIDLRLPGRMIVHPYPAASAAHS